MCSTLTIVEHRGSTIVNELHRAKPRPTIGARELSNDFECQSLDFISFPFMIFYIFKYF